MIVGGKIITVCRKIVHQLLEQRAGMCEECVTSSLSELKVNT